MLRRLKSYSHSINGLYILFFVSGILTGLSLYFYSEDNYEKNLFEALALDAGRDKTEYNNDSALLLNSLHVVHNAIKSRHDFFNNVGGVKAGLIQPLSVDLMTGQGACGSYALVMARLLTELDIESRIVQMKVGDVFGGHNIVEAKYKDSWIVVDPLYDLFFTRPDGSLASFSDVQNNWSYYKQQLPPGYDDRYRYEGVRYTNWSKVPIIMPALKKILDVFMGKEKADTFSIRTLFLRKFQVFFVVTLFFQALNIIYIVLYQRKRKSKSKPGVQPQTLPVTEETKANVFVINPAKTKITISPQ
ncbi:MAG: transglutaminase domain-containing protein [Agriterribacter sp.]